MFSFTKEELGNAVERAIWTFVQAFLAVWVVADTSTLKGAATAGIAGVISLLKTFVVTKFTGGTIEEGE